MPSVETADLIANSRTRNEQFGITGVLLYTGERFLHLIEGRDSDVGALWRNVLADDRHAELTVLYDGHGPERWFTSWRAGYISERTLTPLLKRWQPASPQLADDDIGLLRSLLERTPAF
jgi:hypothetical protein